MFQGQTGVRDQLPPFSWSTSSFWAIWVMSLELENDADMLSVVTNLSFAFGTTCLVAYLRHRPLYYNCFLFRGTHFYDFPLLETFLLPKTHIMRYALAPIHVSSQLAYISEHFYTYIIHPASKLVDTLELYTGR